MAEDLARRVWTFDDLVGEGQSLIPAYAPEWTNHNISDPGITLLELLAYFSEILTYRALRITPDAKYRFLHLIRGKQPAAGDPLLGARSWQVDDAIAAEVQALSQLHCAVTTNDFERVALEVAAGLPEAPPELRARCVPGLDLRHSRGASLLEAPADVNVVLEFPRDLPKDTVHAVCSAVQETLAEKCLLTSRAHVIPAPHLLIEVACRIATEPGVSIGVATEAIKRMLRRSFDPLRRDDTTEGGMRSHAVNLSWVAAAIDRVEGVDYVENVVVRRMILHDADEESSLVGIRIGSVSSVGNNTRLGGIVSVALRRLETDHTGEAETILVRPWEVAHVRLAPDGVQGIAHDASDVDGRYRGGN